MGINAWVSLLFALVVLVGCVVGIVKLRQRLLRGVHSILRKHLGTSDPQQLVTIERTFPLRLRVDLQKAIEQVIEKETRLVRFYGIETRTDVFVYALMRLGDMLVSSGSNRAVKVSPPQYEFVSLGEEKRVRVLRNGLWLLRKGKYALALLMVPSYHRHPAAGMSVQLACREVADAPQVMEHLLEQIAQTFGKTRSYQGKVLSLDADVEDYSGELEYLTVHRVPQVRRDEVILPEETLVTMERNVLDFVKHRESFKNQGLHLKKGLLFYGPPGTGKTHTIRYLVSALQGHTIFLMRAEQMGKLQEYMLLARLMQPSVVIIEDVDLIATQRTTEGHNLPLLNRLLDEMDGLTEETEVLFILTTNRPLVLEEALAGRPGRIDQAIEFPLPDLDCRRRLARLYARGIQLTETLTEEIARRTEGVSAAFIKELMRRAWQYHLEHAAATGDARPSSSVGDALTWQDVEHALEEMTVRGGQFNLKLLGAERIGF